MDDNQRDLRKGEGVRGSKRNQEIKKRKARKKQKEKQSKVL